MGQLHIKCFGMIAEVVGATYVLTDFHGDTEELKFQLFETFPRLKHLTFSIVYLFFIGKGFVQLSVHVLK